MNFKNIVYKNKIINGYLITDCGKVFSNLKGKNLREKKQVITNKGYCRIQLKTNIGCKNFMVHRLVAIAFVDGDKSLEVNHKDFNKTNNRFENLEWVTRKQNMNHAFVNEKIQSCKGEKNGSSVLSEKQVIKIKELIHRKITISKIATMFKVSRSAISKIRCGRTWCHIK